MGKKSKRKKSGIAKTISSKDTQVRYSATELLDRTDGLIDEFQYDLAEKFCKRAVEQEPDNIRAIETHGFLLLQTGGYDEAKACFRRAMDLQPDIGHSKYMYMGQMSEGHDAVQFYQTGIRLMKDSLSKSQEPQEAVLVEASKSDNTKEVTCRDVSNAYCAIAEIYLTDACTEEDAEVRCKENLDLAIETDPNNAEAYHTMASYWLSKDDKQKATDIIEKGVSLWLPRLQNALKPEGQATEDPVEVCLVSYPARISCSKTLIELEKYEVASEILEFLLDENDEVIEVWYLLGLLNYLRGEDFKTNARHYLKKGLELAKKLHFDEIDMLQQMNELLAEIGQDGNEDDDADDDDDDDDMEAESSSDENEVPSSTSAMEH